MLIFPKGNNVDHLSMYLDVADSTTLPYGWGRSAQFSLAIVNQIHNKYTVRKGSCFNLPPFCIVTIVVRIQLRNLFLFCLCLCIQGMCDQSVFWLDMTTSLPPLLSCSYNCNSLYVEKCTWSFCPTLPLILLEIEKLLAKSGFLFRI